MKLMLLGPPGAGKGTQAERISKEYKIPHISTGDIFRKNIKENTELGKKAQEYMNKGLLVPDKLVVDLVTDRLNESDCEKGFLLDGFPRTTAQAEALDEAGINLDRVINIEVKKESLVERAVGRRVCRDCGAAYHIDFKPSQKGNKCDKCGGELYQRDDDTEKTVTKRIEVYTEQTQPLINFYAAKNIVLNIDGEVSIDQVFESILKGLK